MNIRVGIVGISGFGGGGALRLMAGHPSFELVYAAGEGSAGGSLGGPLSKPASRSGQPRCLIPGFDGAICSLEWREALRDKYVTGLCRKLLRFQTFN
jgi:hypothetical protein